MTVQNLFNTDLHKETFYAYSVHVCVFQEKLQTKLNPSQCRADQGAHTQVHMRRLEKNLNQWSFVNIAVISF